MSDLIDRQALIAHLDGEQKYLTDFAFMLAVTACINEIKKAPAAVSDFITCADCRYADGQIADGRHWCGYHEDYMRYCSDAERRER